MVIAPHPDDEAFGCSGTVFLLNEAGVSSTLVFITSGENLYDKPSAEIVKERVGEARRASGLLKCTETVFLGYPDGGIAKNAGKIYKNLHDIIIKTKPDIVFSPSPVDYHQDHIAASEIGLRLLNSLRSFKLAFYEIYSTFQFTHLIDISEVVEKKKQIILNYKKSLYGKPDIYVSASLGLNAHRSVFVQRKGYFEAFHILEKEDSLDNVIQTLSYRKSLE